MIVGPMKKFSSSYVFKKSNFVLLGCEQFGEIDTDWKPIACIVENLLQRGMPTHPSERLINLLGKPRKLKMDRPARKLITHDFSWGNTIKGAPDGRSNPAADFFKTHLPNALPSNRRFIMNYILPEALISDMVSDCDPRFTEQRVDFYCPRANLVIEVDGSQHNKGPQSFLDRERDLYLRLNGIETIRVKANTLSPMEAIHALCERFDAGDELPEGVEEYEIFPYELAIRAQIAIVTLIKQGTLSPDDPTWTIDFTCDRPNVDGNKLIKCATEDVFDLFENICILMDRSFSRPKVRASEESPDLRLDISATKMWSELEAVSGVVYVRNDYYEQHDHFAVAHAKPIAYRTDDPKRREEVDEALSFFLKYLFGYNEFRPGQSGIIRRALARIATLGILPTGSGKSLCYQMACLLQPCINFVVCPIISLIQDQELNSHEFGIDRVGRIESQMERAEKNTILDSFGKGKYFFIWVSPERFQTIDFRQQLNELSNCKHFGYAVIDEVHCLSEWGHDFRVSYLKLYDVIKKYCSEAQIIALTATASRNVLEDLLSELEITKANVQTSTSLDRPELKYHIEKIAEQDREAKLDEILDRIDQHFQIAEGVESIFEPRGEESICGIIFSNLIDNFRKYPATCEGVLAHVRRRGIPADSYHGGRENERSRIQEEFLDNQFTVISATKAFGMGVNKKNIRYTIHNGLPWSIEAFYQEAGRAGRDPARNDSECYILYSNENDPDEARRLFEETTTVDEIIGLQPDLVGDLDTLFFLWSGNHEDLFIERQAIVETFKWLYGRRDKDGHVIAKWNLVKELTRDVTSERARQRAAMEKKTVKAELRIGTQDALYKLAILGIVIDWTVDYNTKTYDVEMREINEDSEAFVKDALQTYIKRHNPAFSFDDPSPSHRKYIDLYQKAPEGNKLIGLIDVLLLWTNDNIVFNRRRAIGNMLDLCESDRSEQEIRDYINSYFRLDTESNDQLDAIVRDTSHIDTWLKLFTTYELTDDPAIQKDVLKDSKEITAIAALCDRYRESFHANIGLEWSTLMAKLLSGTFTKADVESQYEFIAKELPGYTELDSDELFDRTLTILSSASDEAKDAFGSAVVKHSPKRALQTYKKLNDVVSLAYLVNEADNELNSIWRRRSVG